MTVSTTASDVTLQGNGATTSFSYAFNIPNANDVVITITNTLVSPPLQTVLLSSQYSITGLGGTGGIVTYPLTGSALAAGQYITIQRVLPLTQSSVFDNQGNFYGSAVETALDTTVEQVQQVAALQSRALTVNIADNPPATLPIASQRANMALVFDASGNPTAGSVPSSPISSAMLPVMQSATIAAAQSLLGIQTTTIPWVVAGGTADAITATYSPAVSALTDGLLLSVRFASANTTTTPTFKANGTTAHTMTKLGGLALEAGDTGGNLYEGFLRYNLANTTWELLNPANLNRATATITYVVDGGGSVLTTGIKGDLTIPFDCTILEWTLLADQSGSAVVNVWKDTLANYPPTVADKITAAAPPTISAATNARSSTLTGWTTAVTAGDTLRYNIDSITTCTRLTLSLKVKKL